MNLKRVRLELARNPEFPEGSPNHGYEFHVPLTDDGRADEAALASDAQLCTVVRFWGEEEPEHGQIVRRADGSWAFSYEPGEADDEPIFRLSDHVFRQNEYVTITEHDGVARTFRVAWVGPPLGVAPGRPGD